MWHGARISRLREEKGLDFDIEVDGGIGGPNYFPSQRSWGHVFVAGSYVFNGDK